MRILAIDPGPVQSGMVVLDNGRVEHALTEDNFRVATSWIIQGSDEVVALEDFVTYQAVDRHARETIKWQGVFRWCATRPGTEVLELTRSEIKSHLCGCCRGMKDSHVWAACCDWYGVGTKEAKGTKAAPGPLYGVTSHARAALAVALVAHDRLMAAGRGTGTFRP